MKSPLLFQNQPAIEITNGDDRIIVCPGHGARILRWSKAGREIITWPDEADWEKIAKVRGGDPVLFPFIARHYVESRNELWRGLDGTVRRMPQHGFAKDARFSVIDGGPENSLRMRLVDSEETRVFYPFTFQFDVVVTLQSGSRLEVRFETANTGDKPLPYYAGHHFYLAIPHDKRGDWSVEIPCESWGHQAPDGSILHEDAARETLQLDDPSIIDRFQVGPLAGVVLENTVTGQRLVFDLTPSGSIPWYAVTTWTQKPDSDFFCVEPWLGLPNAIHHEEGLRRIQPGEMETATCVLDGASW